MLAIQESETRQFFFLLSCILSSLASNVSSDKALAASLGTLLHNTRHLTVTKFAQISPPKKNSLHLPSHYSQLHHLLYYIICLTCLVSVLWFVILSLLPSQTPLATQIFFHKSTTNRLLQSLLLFFSEVPSICRPFFKGRVLKNE